jgi:hypothetical protein
MNQTVRLAVQEQFARRDHDRQGSMPGARFRYHELRGAGDGRFAARLPELRAAAAAGVPMPTVCVEMLHFVGDFDAAKRRDAIEQMKAQLSVLAEIGGRLAMTPASYGMFSTRLPPFVHRVRSPTTTRCSSRVSANLCACGAGWRSDRSGTIEPIRELDDQHAGPSARCAPRSARRGLVSPQTPTT